MKDTVIKASSKAHQIKRADESKQACLNFDDSFDAKLMSAKLLKDRAL